MNNNPIGLFDSGVGGTSIWKEIHALLPYESSIYLADSKHAPYGEKSKESIIDLSIKNTEYLLDKGCKLIIVACNTATTNTIKILRETYAIPFIGIEPAIKPAALNTKTKAVGMLATKGTLSSDLFHSTTNLYTIGIKVIEQIGEGIVSLIENGKTNSPEMKTLLQYYLEPMLNADIDYLVLGCTHYTYLVPQLVELLPKHVKIIDSSEAVARQTKTVLVNNELLCARKSNPKIQFFSNADPQVLSSLLGEKFEATYLDF